ncbi:MAG: acyl-CoA/acyl-ACP dehydrogenase [Streptosporangiales bacterium]|nr:acyl-CoA/acyl-ACP dehydrogenase [Streptosporangiales bacterium]
MTAVPDLLYSADEDALRSGVRDLLAERSPHPAVLARIETDTPYDPDLWHALAAQIGVTGLAVPEPYGGAGASWHETAVVAEELGRSVAPTPFLGSAVLATAALLALDHRLLGTLAAGETTATLVIPLSMPPDARFPDTVRADGALTGSVTSVADALTADVLLVPAVGGGGPTLSAVAREQAAVTRVVSLDATRPLADVAFDGASGELLASGPEAERAVAAAVAAGAAMLASEQLGLAEQCLESTVAYLEDRHQFGRPVGSFQALKHRLADVWVSITQARAAARYAAACLSSGAPDTPVAVAVAASYCAETAVHAAEECLQLHGGIGFTWEHPAHLYLKRAKADALALGAPHRHRAALGPLVDLTL